MDKSTIAWPSCAVDPAPENRSSLSASIWRFGRDREPDARLGFRRDFRKKEPSSRASNLGGTYFLRQRRAFFRPPLPTVFPAA